MVAGAGGAGAQLRPNFIILIADDLGWEDSGAYGSRVVRTPNIDRLAREGVRFTHAFLTTSSCSPSRASILTGRYPHSTGAPELHMPLPADQVLLTAPLRQAGYWTGAAGKWHLGGQVKRQFDLVREGGSPSGCENWLGLLRERPRDRPFFAWLAAVDPHRPYSAGATHPRHDPSRAETPPFLPDAPEVRQDLADYYDEISRMDRYIGEVLQEIDAQGIARETFVLFLSDNGRPFPRCKTRLYDSGIRTPFIVRYPAGARAGAEAAGLVSSVDIATTVAEMAGCAAPSSFQGRSFRRMLSDPQAVIRSEAFAEHNWHDYMAYERSVRSSRYCYIRNWLPELTANPPADAVRSPSFQFMVRQEKEGRLPPEQRDSFIAPRAGEELFDTAFDPHCMFNVAGDPKYAGVLEQHRGLLDTWRKETGDTFDRSKLTPDRFHRQEGTPLAG